VRPVKVDPRLEDRFAVRQRGARGGRCGMGRVSEPNCEEHGEDARGPLPIQHP
jgi:hypothetical protein